MFLLLNFFQVDLLDQHYHFKISSVGAPIKSALKVDSDPVEWALKVPM